MHIYNIHVQTSCKAKMFHIRETIRFSHNKVGWFMVFNATFNNISVISWWSVLFVEETGVPGENHRPE